MQALTFSKSLSRIWVASSSTVMPSLSATGCMHLRAALALPWAKYWGSIRPSTLAASVLVKQMRLPLARRMAT